MKVATTRERLKQIMHEKGLRQIDVVNLCEPYSIGGTKVTRSDMSLYLKGRHEPATHKLSILARALDTNEAYLMGFDVDNRPKSQLRAMPVAQTALTAPIVSTVAGGKPIFATSNIEGYVAIDKSLATSDAELFALRIKGESMYPLINDGDIVICRKQETVDNNEIAIVLVGTDSATCKKVIKQQNGLLLVSQNSTHDPLFFTANDVINTPVQIVAKVLEVRRKIN